MDQSLVILTVAFTVCLFTGVTIGRRWPSSRDRRFKVKAQRRPLRRAADFNAAVQLQAVERAVFKSRALLNQGERRLFALLEHACRDEALGWRVMAQVSLGEILSSPDQTAFRAVNSKRVDLLIVSSDGWPLHAVEFQGSGHYLGSAATRDAIKKEALRRAGIGYHEVVGGDTPAEVRSLVAKLSHKQRVAA